MELCRKVILKESDDILVQTSGRYDDSLNPDWWIFEQRCHWLAKSKSQLN